MEIGLIELVLVFAGVIALALWDLAATRQSLKAAPSRPEPHKPPETPARKPKAARRPSAKTAQRSRSKAAT